MKNDNNEKMGSFISEMRKSKGFTQKEMAEKLGVTDKAVSKWERGLSCPDIALLVPLAKLLDVSTNELLTGETRIDMEPEAEEVIVNEALNYSSKSTAEKIEKLKQNLLLGVSAIFLIAIVTCLICEYAIAKDLMWSLIVIESVIAGWLLLFPSLALKNKIFKKTLIVLSLISIPFLTILSGILSMPLVFTVGTAVSIVSIVGVWCIYGIFMKFHKRIWRAFGFSFIVIIPLSLIINHMAAHFTESAEADPASDILNVVITLVVAIVCLGVDYFHQKKA